MLTLHGKYKRQIKEILLPQQKKMLLAAIGVKNNKMRFDHTTELFKSKGILNGVRTVPRRTLPRRKFPRPDTSLTGTSPTR